MANFYIPRQSNFGGNPWQGAANAYGNELDRLGTLQQEGMTQTANAPMTLYKMFMEGFEKAQAQKQAEEAEALRQAQLERQQMLAEETLRHNRSTEEFNMTRLKQQDSIAEKARNMGFFRNEVDPSFTGDPAAVESWIKQAEMSGIPKEVAVEYFNSRKVAGKPSNELQNTLVGEGIWSPGAAGAELGAPESYIPGTQYKIKKDAAAEANRAHVEAERLRLKAEERQAIRDAEAARHNRASEQNFLAALAQKGKGAKATNLAEADDADMALIDMLGTYRALPEKVLGRGQDRARILSLVYQKYPGYDIGQAAQHFKFLQDLASTRVGSAGGYVDSANRMTEHASDLADIIKASGGGEGWGGKIGNIISYPTQMMTGNKERFELIKGKLLAEAEKLVTGGVPHVEQMKRDIETLNFTDPIDKKMKILSSVIDIGIAQTNALEEKRRNILRDQAPDTTLLSPESVERANKIYKAAGRNDLVGTPTSKGYGALPGENQVEKKAKEILAKPKAGEGLPTPKTKDEYDALPKGTVYVDTDGKTKTKTK